MVEPKLNKKVLAERKKFLDDLLKRRFFYTNGFEIYGGVAGLYDYGPAGCAIKTNIEQFWREHFILEEDMLEVNCTCLTPEVVLKTSGHVDKFDDLIVKDVKTNAGFRADKLLAEVIEKQLDNKKISEEQRKELQTILSKVDTYKKDEMKEIFQRLKVKSPDTGNDLTDPESFNLMFGTQIGPSGGSKGYLRPETAQGIFVNFNKLLDYNNGRMPFAGAQLGLGFRNEIAPRGGLLRVREFQMAEIEHFVDPLDKNHPKFENYKSMRLPLYSQDQQEKLGEPLRDLSLEDAVKTKVINNETLAYFMARTYLFLVGVGICPDNLRFRQHMKDEMAHYASDCWDAEIETSSGWIECVGIADRACFDLSRHGQASKVNLVAARRLPKPEVRKVLTLNFNRAKIGQSYKQSSKILLNYIENLDEAEREKLRSEFEPTKNKTLTLEGVDFVLTEELINFEVKEQTVSEEKFCPSVIEPSFGIGRILYCMLEHRFKMRDEKRTYLDLPPKIAPVKCSILTVISSPKYQTYIQNLKKDLTRAGISSKVDDGGQSIGKRYARTDEIGIPFGITIDNQTIDDNTVTLRELNTTKQIRLPLADVVRVISDSIEGFVTWEEILKKYPAFELKEADKE